MAKLRLNPLSIFWHILRNDVHKLEYDAHVQWRFHLLMTRYWAMNFPVIIYLFFWHQKTWLAAALFINTMYSLYANLSTDFGAVPASYAAWKAQQASKDPEKADKFVPPFAH